MLETSCSGKTSHWWGVTGCPTLLQTFGFSTWDWLELACFSSQTEGWVFFRITAAALPWHWSIMLAQDQGERNTSGHQLSYKIWAGLLGENWFWERHAHKIHPGSLLQSRGNEWSFWRSDLCSQIVFHNCLLWLTVFDWICTWVCRGMTGLTGSRTFP